MDAAKRYDRAFLNRSSRARSHSRAHYLWDLTSPVFRYSDTWQLIVNTATTIVTVLIDFLIQNSRNRDGATMKAKLDELTRALNKARETFIGFVHLTERQICTALEDDCRNEPDKYEGKGGTILKSVDRLLA